MGIPSYYNIDLHQSLNTDTLPRDIKPIPVQGSAILQGNALTFKGIYNDGAIQPVYVNRVNVPLYVNSTLGGLINANANLPLIQSEISDNGSLVTMYSYSSSDVLGCGRQVLYVNGNYVTHFPIASPQTTSYPNASDLAVARMYAETPQINQMKVVELISDAGNNNRYFSISINMGIETINITGDAGANVYLPWGFVRSTDTIYGRSSDGVTGWTVNNFSVVSVVANTAFVVMTYINGSWERYESATTVAVDPIRIPTSPTKISLTARAIGYVNGNKYIIGIPGSRYPSGTSAYGLSSSTANDGGWLYFRTNYAASPNSMLNANVISGSTYIYPLVYQGNSVANIYDFGNYIVTSDIDIASNVSNVNNMIWKLSFPSNDAVKTNYINIAINGSVNNNIPIYSPQHTYGEYTFTINANDHATAFGKRQIIAAANILNANATSQYTRGNMPTTYIVDAIAAVRSYSPDIYYERILTTTNALSNVYHGCIVRGEYTDAGLSALSVGTFVRSSTGYYPTVGKLITTIGSIDPSYPPFVSENPSSSGQIYIIYNTSDSGMSSITFVNANPSISKIGNDIFSINTVDAYSIIDLSNGISINPGSSDFSGEVAPYGPPRNRILDVNTQAIPTETTTVASVYRSNNGSYVSVGEQTCTLTVGAYLGLYANHWSSRSDVYTDSVFDIGVIDFYVGGNYRNTISLKARTSSAYVYIPGYVDSSMDGKEYPISTSIPLPAGTSYMNSIATIGNTIVYRNIDSESYPVGNELKYPYSFFSLFGQTYAFDGVFIYIVTLNGDIVNDITEYCPARGLQFITVTPTEAWFLSSFDNSLFTFTGGRTLQKSIKMTQLANVNTGIWNSKENTLAFITGNTSINSAGPIYIRDGLITGFNWGDIATPLNLATSEWTMYSTSNGIKLKIYDVAGSELYYKTLTYVRNGTDTSIPITWRSSYFGLDRNTREQITEYVVTLYSPNRAASTVTLTHDSFDQGAEYNEQNSYVINANAWSTEGYYRIRLIPKYQKVYGTSLTVSGNIAGRVALTDIAMATMADSKAVINPAASK